MITLDACGISCPEPLVMLQNALKTNKELMLLLDSKNALDNCIHYAEKQGFTTKTTQEDDVFKIHIV